ncbi:endonuclease NucS [Methanosphaera sp.]
MKEEGIIIKFKTIENPENKEAYTVLKEGFDKKAMIIVLAECHVEYEGRARSRLDKGDRLILIKKDGTFAIHQELNLDPVNWQAPGCKNKVKLDDNQIILISKKTKPTEEIKVFLDTIYNITYYNCLDTKDLEIRGYEKHMVDLAWEKPELIEKGFRPTRREYQTENGFIDLMGTDAEEKLMILEFKSRKAGTNAVKQLKGYMDCFKDNKEFVRGIIVAPDITDNARELLESLQMEFISMNPPLDLLKQKASTLDSFF